MQPIARFVNEGLPGVPRPISPKTHKILDVLTTSAFLLAGAFMWSSNRRASAAAFLNAGLVLGMTLFTDYDGDGRRPLSFEAHGQLDVAQASLAAAAPHLFGFADEKKSWLFRGQAMNEGMVVAMTDFPAAQRTGSQIRDVAA
jgi:hypothetical protein